MSTPLKVLVDFTDQYLGIGKIKDYCPNGLQVEGRSVVSKILGGVTASQALIDAAVQRGVDAILVHHGYFWSGENAAIVGIKRQRIKTLLAHEISLLAYHLPLDLHPEVGNNIQLAHKLGLEVTGPLDLNSVPSTGLAGQFPVAITAADFASLLQRVLGRPCLHIGAPEQQLKTIGWCTGAAQGMINQAASLGLDAYLSGEISEPTVHIARETGVHYFAAGHHATERYGIQALGDKLMQQFDLSFEFLDIDNPV